MLITPVPEVASAVEQAGVERIFIDMETRGKHERQFNAGTPINAHTFEDAARVKSVLRTASLLIRINPLYDGSVREVEQALEVGADVIMLPYFSHPEEVKAFLSLVRGRCRTSLLFETAGAIGRAEQIIRIGGYDELHLGLNDFRLTLGHDFLFESFAGGVIEWLCSLAQRAGVSYGIGGIGRIGKELLPAELVLREHVRLGSDRVILSRVFHGEAKSVAELKAYGDIAAEVRKLRQEEIRALQRTPEEVEADRIAFVTAVSEIADKIRSKKRQQLAAANG